MNNKAKEQEQVGFCAWSNARGCWRNGPDGYSITIFDTVFNCAEHCAIEFCGNFDRRFPIEACEKAGWQIRKVKLVDADSVVVPRGLMEWVEMMRNVLINQSIPFHYTCDDCWYSCPKSGECCDDKKDKNICECGEDARVASVQAQLERLEKILPQQEKD